ncbi:MAG: hypothetical protein ACKOAU_12415 [Pirellula sp.]
MLVDHRVRKSRKFWVFWVILAVLLSVDKGFAGRGFAAAFVADPEIAALDQIRLDYASAIGRRDEIFSQYNEALRLRQRTIFDAQAYARAMARGGPNGFLINFNVYMAAQQMCERRILACNAKQINLEIEFNRWTLEWPKFMERYWPHSDPERIFDGRQIEDRLKILVQADPADYPATIVYVLLIERLGRHNEGLVRIDMVIEAHTSLDAIALLVKSSLLQSAHRAREARIAIQQARQAVAWLPKGLVPIYRYLQGRVAAAGGDESLAQTEWQAVAVLRSLELESHRSLAILHSVGAGLSLQRGKQAIKEAQMALDLDSDPDWFGYFVMAMAYHAAKDKPNAIKQLRLAQDLAQNENQALCLRLEKCIDTGSKFAWDFRNLLQQPQLR